MLVSAVTTQNIAAACAGLLGGFVYDVIPGGKIGIGVLMTLLNTLHLCGFIFALVLVRPRYFTPTREHMDQHMRHATLTQRYNTAPCSRADVWRLDVTQELTDNVSMPRKKATTIS